MIEAKLTQEEKQKKESELASMFNTDLKQYGVLLNDRN